MDVIYLSIERTDVVMVVREHFENKGYSVSTVSGKYMDIPAKKDKDTFFIEAIGQTSRLTDQNIIFALGKTVKRIMAQSAWIHYGIAIPKIT